MAEIKWLADTTLQTLSDPNASLANGVRWAFDYDNSTELDVLGFLYFAIQYDTTAPAQGDDVLEVYVMPGDGEGTETFPRGGDGTVGGDDDPDARWHVGTVACREPSLTTDEVLGLVIPLYPDGNRIVVKNVSQQTISLERIAKLKPWKTQAT